MDSESLRTIVGQTPMDAVRVEYQQLTEAIALKKKEVMVLEARLEKFKKDIQSLVADLQITTR